MRKIQVTLAIFLGFGFAVLIQSFFNLQVQTAKANGNIVYVSASDPACAGHSPCFVNIQNAVNAAATGDSVFISGGVYTDADVPVLGYMVKITKSLLLQGGYDANFSSPPDPEANPTRFDAQGLGRVIYISGTVTPTLDGIKITGGDAAGLGGGTIAEGGPDAGGGIYVNDANLVIRRSQVFSNTSEEGGGVFLTNGAAAFEDVNIYSNTTIVYTSGQMAMGGGVFLFGGDATFNDCAIIDNHATVSGTAHWSGGGGIFFQYSNVTFRDSRISGNSAIQPGGGLEGYNSQIVFVNNIIEGNTSVFSNGGGLYIGESDVYMQGNIITNNSTRYYGGGLVIQTYSTAILDGNIITGNISTQRDGGGMVLRTSDITMTNNVVSDNRAAEKGSGIAVQGAHVIMLHNTIARNAGGDGIGIYITHYKYHVLPTLHPAKVALTNTILVSHSIGISIATINTATLNGVLWYGTPITIEKSITASVSTQNQWTGNPAFALDGYHLSSASAATNKGIWTTVRQDIDQQPRLGLPDFGADEYWPPGVIPRFVFLPLLIR